MEVIKKLWYLIALILFISAVSTFGYMVIEGWPLLDAFYMTVITLGTVGFTEIHGLSDMGRIWTILVIASGIGTVGFAFAQATRIIIESELHDLLRRRKMIKEIAKMKNHYIICGYGRIGQLICRELREKNVKLVVIDDKAEVIDEVKEKNYPAVLGDATKEEILREAAIEKAKGLVCAVDSDAENVYISLVARSINDNLYIVARATDDDAEDKLLKAGANRVVSPYNIGGLRMAQAILQPTVVDFFEIATTSESMELQIEQVKIGNKTELLSKTLAQSNIRNDFGVIIIAIRRSDGSFLYNPASQTVLHEGDCLVAMGEPENMVKLQKKAQG